MTSLKINLVIYDAGGDKKVYGKDITIDSVNSNITQVGIMQDVTNDISLTADTKISFKTITANTRIKFLNVSTMRGRKETNGQMTPYIVNEKSPYFANTYGNNTIYHDAKGSGGKYYYYVTDIIKNNNYYPINLYGLEVRTSVKNSTTAQTVYCTSANKDDGVPCMRPASKDSIDSKFSTKIYALGTWITPISITNFKIGCKDGYTLFGDSCCPTSPINRLINKYNTDQKECCKEENFAKNYNTGATECCPTLPRKVYTSGGKINLCGEICKTTITCPSNTQKDIDGKCCNTKDKYGNYTINSTTGKCDASQEVAVEDSTGTICKVSEMGGTCKCKPLEEEYTCKPDSASRKTTPKRPRFYKVRLIKSNDKTTCSEKYVVTFNKEVSVLQGGYFNYPVGLTVIRECEGEGVTMDNLPSYSADQNIIKTAIADIYLKKVSVNAEQTNPTLLEHNKANDNQKDYEIILDKETITPKGSVIKQETKYKLVEYKHNYYLNTFTGKIRDAALGIGDGYLPSGKYVYILLNAPTGKYKNDVILNIHGNTIKINCSYEIKENIIQKYAYRQFDTAKVFARSKIGNNWKTETAQRIITKIQSSANEVYEEGRAMYEINLDTDSINKIKAYVDSNGYYNTEFRNDGTSKFIYETFNTNILINKNENILKDIIN